MHRHEHGEPTVAVGVSMAVLAVGLVVTLAGVPFGWLVWPLGYGVALPLSLQYASTQRGDHGRESPDAVQAAREAYVAGDIDEAELERRVEAGLEKT